MADILAGFTTFFTWVTTNMTSLVNWITATPLVMAVIAMFFVGFIVSIFFRIFHTAQGVFFLSGILSTFTDFFNWLFVGGEQSSGVVSGLVSWIVGTPLVMAVIAMFFVGFIVSIFFRIFHTA